MTVIASRKHEQAHGHWPSLPRQPSELLKFIKEVRNLQGGAGFDWSGAIAEFPPNAVHEKIDRCLLGKVSHRQPAVQRLAHEHPDRTNGSRIAIWKYFAQRLIDSNVTQTGEQKGGQRRIVGQGVLPHSMKNGGR